MRHHGHSHGHAHTHAHAQAHSHVHEQEHLAHPGKGHNAGPNGAVQWQTPHLPEGEGQAAPVDDSQQDFDLVETAFVEAFTAASDPTSFLRLAGVPFSGARADGQVLNLLRVEQSQSTDVGNLTPHLGGESFRYAQLPAEMTSRRNRLCFVYFDGTGPVELSLAEAKALSQIGS